MNLKMIFDKLKSLFLKKSEFAFKYFEVHLTEHCNLNCQSCFHFSCLAEEEYADINIFEKDFKRMSELSNGKIESFLLLGGEPLLHPELHSFFEISRKYFPKADIQLVTNGVLLPVQGEDFWIAMKKNNIILRPTKYPINLDYKKIEEKAREYNIRVHYFNDIKISSKIPLNIDGKLNPRKTHKRCGCKTCYILNKGKIYPCSTAGNIHHFIKFFNLDIKNDEKNGIDIYKAKDIYEIDNFLKKRIPLCKHCRGVCLMYKEWAVTKKDINEWVE